MFADLVTPLEDSILGQSLVSLKTTSTTVNKLTTDSDTDRYTDNQLIGIILGTILGFTVLVALISVLFTYLKYRSKK